MKIDVFTDGSATTADKPGGYAWVITVNNKFYLEGSGHLEKASNNDAELIGAIRGLEAALNTIFNLSIGPSFPFEPDVTLKSDSQLILGWTDGTYRFKQMEKMFLYEELRRFARKLKVKTEWIKGHSGVEWNERCDKLANAARLGKQLEEKKKEAKTTGRSLIGKKKEGVACFWFKDKLKVIDFSNNICEDYDREEHGKRGSAFEIREDRLR